MLGSHLLILACIPSSVCWCCPWTCRLRWQAGWVWPGLSNSGFRSLYPPLSQQCWTLRAQLWSSCASICNNRHTEPLQQGYSGSAVKWAAVFHCYYIFRRRSLVTFYSSLSLLRTHAYNRNSVSDWCIGPMSDEGHALYLSFWFSCYLPATKVSRQHPWHRNRHCTINIKLQWPAVQ